MSFFKRVNNKKKSLPSKIDDLDFVISENELVEKFSKLNNADRMGTIVKYGDTGDLKYYPLIRYAIKQDTDIHVKFAALKRVHLLKEHPDVVPMLNELKERINTELIEPYYSMALSRVGIISIEEFKDRMNKP